jgi:hypothetical protein
MKPTLTGATANSSDSSSRSNSPEVSKQDSRMVAYQKCWEFFWNSLTFGEKCAVEAGTLALALFIGSAGYWLGDKLSESRLKQQDADNINKATQLQTTIANLERKLSERYSGNEPTLQTAKATNRSYADFVRDLEAARKKDSLTVTSLVDQYNGKKVRWVCTILRANSVEKWYTIGVDEHAVARNQAFAQFRADEFDRFAKDGERKTIEGVFRSADDEGIVLYDCRFATEAKQP